MMNINLYIMYNFRAYDEHGSMVKIDKERKQEQIY